MNARADRKDVDDSHGGCHFIPGVLAVRPADLGAAREALKEMGGARDATRRTLSRYLRPPDKGDPVDPPIAILSVDDPHEAAEFLANLDHPIAASPIHGVGYESHGRFMSGAGPKQAPQFTAVRPLKSQGVIAVVDSGIVDPRLRPKWMQSPYVRHDRQDVERLDKNPASHGTFVTSIIRQVAPDHEVSLAAAPPDTNGVLVTSIEGGVVDPPTTELDVLAALMRLTDRHKANPSEVKALNLSLGASAHGAHDGFLLTLQAALDHWRDHIGRSVPIFAAGGNARDMRPVYPGAFDCVHAVGAGAKGGKQTVWDQGSAQTAPPRNWISDVAPGVKIKGLSGKSTADTVWWSGSSFATAVASSLTARGETFEVDGGVTYWKDRSITYPNVAGLHYM